MAKAKKALGISLWIILALALIIGLFLGWYYRIRPSRIGEFTAEDYTYYLEKFPSNTVVGAITDARDARKKGVAILTDIYSDDVISGEAPFVVYYDEQTDSWLICGSMPPIPFMRGGIGKIIIRGSDGDVLAVWHEK